MRRFPRLLATLTLMLAALVAVGACGGDESALCKSLKDLKGSVESVEGVDLDEDGLSGLEGALGDVDSDVAAARDAAEEEIGPELDALEASLAAVATVVQGIADAGSVSEDSVAALATAVAATITSYEAIEQAAPDCDI